MIDALLRRPMLGFGILLVLLAVLLSSVVIVPETRQALIVQLRSIWSWDGAGVPAKPSRTPLGYSEQSSARAACPINSSITRASARKATPRSAALSLMLLHVVICALVPLSPVGVVAVGTEAARISGWIPAVPPSWGLVPFRPVTLRHHLSVVLPLSESR